MQVQIIMNIGEENKMVKFLIMDVDGTLTDGKIYMGSSGEICKAFSIKDGCGIHDIAIPAGIEPIVITGRKSDIVMKRCREIGIEKVYQGIRNKIEKLLTITTDLREVAYIGDDINDLSCMIPVKAAGGIVGCPKDAVKDVIVLADYVAEHNGGEGAVRDFVEWLVEQYRSHVK